MSKREKFPLKINIPKFHYSIIPYRWHNLDVNKRISNSINCRNWEVKLKQCVDKWCNSTPFSKDNQHPQKRQHDYNREQPIAFSQFQKLPEFTDKRLIGHFCSLPKI